MPIFIEILCGGSISEDNSFLLMVLLLKLNFNVRYDNRHSWNLRSERRLLAFSNIPKNNFCRFKVGLRITGCSPKISRSNRLCQWKSSIKIQKNITFWVLLFIFIPECTGKITTNICRSHFPAIFSIFHKILLYVVSLHNSTRTLFYQFLLSFWPIYLNLVKTN